MDTKYELSDEDLEFVIGGVDYGYGELVPTKTKGWFGSFSNIITTDSLPLDSWIEDDREHR